MIGIYITASMVFLLSTYGLYQILNEYVFNLKPENDSNISKEESKEEPKNEVC